MQSRDRAGHLQQSFIEKISRMLPSSRMLLSQGVEAKMYRRPPIPGHQEQADTGVLTEVNFILLASQPGGTTRAHEQRHPWVSENF